MLFIILKAICLLCFSPFRQGLGTYWTPPSTSVKSEVIDLEDASNICQNLEDYPFGVFSAVGGLLNQGDPLVCGGHPA
jgi:hypothetical protein